MTVHNMAFQGTFGADIFAQLRLPPHAFSVEGVEYYGGVGYLKAGWNARCRHHGVAHLCRRNPHARLRDGA